MADPEEENLKTVYYALIDFFDANNPAKVQDEDALAVLLDYWIDYGLESLNRLLRRKYNKGIDNVIDPYVGGLIARKERTPKDGWPYPSNHPKYKDPLAPIVDDSIVLPPPKHSAPKQSSPRNPNPNPNPNPKANPKPSNKPRDRAQSSRRQQGQSQQRQRRDPKQRGASTDRQAREKKPREDRDRDRDRDRGESARRRKREDRGLSNKAGPRGPHRGGGDQRVSAKRAEAHRDQGQARKGGQSSRLHQAVEGQGGGKRGRGGGEATNALQRSLHYKDRSRQRQKHNKQSARLGAQKEQRPKFGQFRSLDDFDSPSDVQLSTQHYVEAFYAAYNREVLLSATGVGALVKWVEAHSIEEFNRNLRKKYGSSMDEVGVKRAAVRRRNIEGVLTDLYEFYDKGKLRKMDMSQMVNKVVFGGVEVLNKEIRQYAKRA